MQSRKRLLSLGLVVLTSIFLLTSCGGGSGSEAGSEDAAGPNEVDQASALFSSLCGVVGRNEIVANPGQSAEPVTVQVLSSDTVVVTRQSSDLAGQQQLVKLHAITSEGVETLRVLNGIDILKRELAEGAMFVPAGENCEVVFPGGGLGVLGQIFSLDGENMSERMLMEAAAVPTSNDMCLSDALSSCYVTIGVIPREATDIELDMQDVALESTCGAVKNGELINPATKAEIVRVEPVTTSLAVVTRLLGVESGIEQVVKLHGLTSSGISENRLQEGRSFIINSAFGGAYMVQESSDCTSAVESGESGAVVQLYSMDGLSINEELLSRGYAAAENDSCGGDLLTECYTELEAAAPPEPVAPPPAPPSSHDSDEDSDQGGYIEGIIRDFLWKPVSEADGRLAVLVNPTNVRIVVTGAITETLRHQGPSNGRGTTARGSAPGCAYGANVVVQFFDSSGNAIPVITGGTSVTIANGCSRFEFRR